jgi:N utilization substance protein B
MRVRHEARVTALQALYEIDCAGHAPEVVVDQRLIKSELPENGQQFARELAIGVSENREMLDSYIARYAPEWPVDQIAVIDRNVLRLAVYEILIGTDTPVKVAINEAVELAKDFGSDSSGRFVNGVLGTLVAKETTTTRR